MAGNDRTTPEQRSLRVLSELMTSVSCVWIKSNNGFNLRCAWKLMCHVWHRKESSTPNQGLRRSGSSRCVTASSHVQTGELFIFLCTELHVRDAAGEVLSQARAFRARKTFTSVASGRWRIKVKRSDWVSGGDATAGGFRAKAWVETVRERC